MAKTTAQVPVDTYTCDGASCGIEHTVKPGETPSGYLVSISALTLGEKAAAAAGDDDREVYACKQGCIGRAVAGRVKALQVAAATADDGEAAPERHRTDEEEAALEDGYDGPMPDDLDSSNDEDEGDGPEAAGDGWDDEMKGERAAAGAHT